MIQNLDKRTIDNLVQWLTYELDRARSERSPMEQDWIRYQRVYRARPENPNKDFPFKGAANFVVPVAATDVDITVAGVMGTIMSSPNIWTTEALRPDWINLAARTEEYLEYAQETQLKMYKTLVEWITEIVKLGTGILKQRYLREEKRVLEWRETQTGLSGGQPQVLQQMVRKIISNRPEVKRVALANFYVPGTATSIADAGWCAERLELSWTQLEARVRAGIYSADFIAKVGAHWRGQQSRTQYHNYQSAQEQLDNFLPGQRDKFEIFEFWTDYDILRDGEPQSVVCTIHLPTMSYGRADFNPFFHQEKPYSDARFLVQEGRFYGIGLIEMQEAIQDVISTMQCQRVDNATIRNTTLLKARRGSGVRADEPIWPGRIFIVDNPAEDLVPMPMGYPAESTLDDENQLLSYAQRRGGVSDWQAGGAGQPALSYSTATTTVEMLKQGKMKLDQFIREVDRALSETGQRVVELLQQYDQAGVPYLVMGDQDGAVVQQVLQFPLDTIRLGIAVKVTSTNAQANRETKIRTDQIIFGTVTQAYQQMFQAMTIVVNPQVPPALRMLAFQMIQGGTTLVRQILDAYQVQNMDAIFPSVEQLNALVANFAAGQTADSGGAGLAQGPASAPGVPAAAGVPAGGYGGNNSPLALAAGPQ